MSSSISQRSRLRLRPQTFVAPFRRLRHFTSILFSPSSAVVSNRFRNFGPHSSSCTRASLAALLGIFPYLAFASSLSKGRPTNDYSLTEHSSLILQTSFRCSFVNFLLFAHDLACIAPFLVSSHWHSSPRFHAYYAS